MIGDASQCSTCIGAPSSKETADWLQELINRRYGQQRFKVRYLDLEEEGVPMALKAPLNQAIDERIFPLILINGQVISEGIPNPRVILAALDK